MDRTETRAPDHYRQAQFDNTGSKRDRISGPPKNRHSDHSVQILNWNVIQIQSAKLFDIQDRTDPRSDPSEACSHVIHFTSSPTSLTFPVSSRLAWLFLRFFSDQSTSCFTWSMPTTFPVGPT
jgi:hypothetical protein